MGLSCSCPLSFYFDLGSRFESLFGNSIKQEGDEKHTLVQPSRLKPLSSGKLLREGSLRFRSRKAQTTRFNDNGSGQESVSLLSRSGSLSGPVSDLDPSSPKHEAAIKLQKVYKSFRTRRKLADCAVLIEQSWWKVLDFAELKHSSISFFDIEKHETAISRWSRARTRAAKVGKGLSQNNKAQKLALQHWLEAIDPRHRYGHNLHFYYMKWLDSQSKEPFFYWLDIGEGKEVNIIEKCPRSKLHQQCIKYLGPMEREAYEVTIENGKLLYKETRELLDTIDEPKGCKWIFVLSTSRTFYVGKKKKGSFQHSSFLAGGATMAAGRIVANKGVLKAVWPHSGHYRPTEENFQDFVSFLTENNVDLNGVELDSVDDEDKESTQKHIRNFSGNDLIGKDDSTKESTNMSFILEETFGSESCNVVDTKEEKILEDSIFERINSHKGMKSYQLGKQLSCKWSTGAGPRIGCLRDYPSGLQTHALEQVNLSPRSKSRLRFEFPSRASTSGSNLSRATSCSLESSSSL